MLVDWASVAVTLLGVAFGGVLGFLGTQWTEKRRHERERKEADKRDLDETRRLLLMVKLQLEGYAQVSHHLAATLMNALVTHSKLLTSEEADQFGKNIVTRTATVQVVNRIDELIAQIDERLSPEGARD